MQILWLLLYAIMIINYSPVYAGSGAPCPPLDLESKNNHIILPGSSHSVSAFFLQNISSNPVIVDHPQYDSGAHAGLSSTLDPNHWSVLQIDKKNYRISCTTSQADHWNTVNCNKVLVVCVPPKLVLNNTTPGIFWLAENKELNDLLKELSDKGIKYN